MIFLHFVSYALIRSGLFLISLLPYKIIHKMGNGLSFLLFPCLTRYRKRALSNLAIAKDLQLSNEQIRCLARESLASLLITTLEYGKLAREKNIENIAICVNPQEANEIYQRGKGIVFFCSHQANWEVLFLEGTLRMKGVAIGQPIKNHILYDWIVRIREKFGGRIIEPKQAVKEGLKALKKGVFLGIVGDQGMPEGGFSSSFLGRNAYTSPLSALLSHRSDCPIIVATTNRKNGKYWIHYSKALWPNLEKSSEEDVSNLMNQTLHLLEESIKQNPGQWLWQHNKWKQQGPLRLKKKYRHDTIAVFLPADSKSCQYLLEELKVLREIYPTEFLSFFIPDKENIFIEKNIPSEIVFYRSMLDLKREDYRFKMIFNFTEDLSLCTHYLKLAAFQALTLEDLKKLSKSPQDPLSSQLKKVILNAI